MMIDYEKTLTKGTQASLDKTEIENNKLRFTTDTGRLFLDIVDQNTLSNKRLEITDFAKDYTEDQILSIQNPLPKIYLSLDTSKLFIYANGKWNVCGGDTVEHAKTADSATKATNDELDQNIASNYIKALNLVNNDTLDIGRGNGDGSTLRIDPFSKANNGFVPSPNTDENTNKFLKGNGTWSDVEHSASSDKAAEADHASNAENAKNATNANHATTADESDKAINDANGKRINTTYAPLASPIFTGTPTTPDIAEGNQSLQVANTNFVMKAISKAIANVTQFNTVIVEDKSKLPSTGAKGTIYFVPNAGSGDNAYDEYVWVGTKYECLGPHQIDLSAYFDNVSTSGTGNAITSVNYSGSTITFVKGATFLTEHPSITTISGTDTAAPGFGGTVTVNSGIEKDKYGHITNIKTKTITIPNTIGNTTAAGLTKLYTGTGNNTDGSITQKDITTLLSGKSDTNHNHDSVYQAKGSYAATNHNHDTVYSKLGHNHDSAYSKLGHTHTRSEITDFPSAMPGSRAADNSVFDFEFVDDGTVL